MKLLCYKMCVPGRVGTRVSVRVRVKDPACASNLLYRRFALERMEVAGCSTECFDTT